MKMRAVKMLIVEDNVLMQNVLKEVVSTHFSEINTVGVANSVVKAIQKIELHEPHIVLMDIHLSGGTAFDILKQTDNSKFKVIFISAYHEYMLEALKFSSVDFIFKPFDVNEIVFAIDKALNEMDGGVEMNSHKEMVNALISNVDVDDENKQLVIVGFEEVKIEPYRNIVWGRSDHRNSEFHFSNNQSFTSSNSLRTYEVLLQNKGFIRCHSHYLVNTFYIDYVDPVEGFLELKTGGRLPINSSRYDAIMSMMQSGLIQNR